jgi:hypothetical protein
MRIMKQRGASGNQNVRITLLVLSVALLAICGGSDYSYAQIHASTPFGTSFTPRHYPNIQDEDVWQAFMEVGAVGNHLSFMIHWSEGNLQVAKLRDLFGYCREIGLKTVLQLNPTGLGQPAPPSALPPSFGASEVQARFLADVGSLAGLHPDYLLLATEINLMHYLNPDEFARFIPLYRTAYQTVKEISPETRVGVSYHLDLFFGAQEYDLVQQMGPQDFAGFTTYPAWTVYKGYYPQAGQVPSLYYDRIRDLLPDIPIIFSEVGWPSGGPGNMQDQADFVASLPRLMQRVQPELITWAMLHDVNYFNVDALTPEQAAIIRGFDLTPEELFSQLNTMGLLSLEGPPKPSWFKALELIFNPPSLQR